MRDNSQRATTEWFKYKVNSAYLADYAVVEEMKQLWNGLSYRIGFPGKLPKLVRWYKMMSLKKMKQRKEREANLRTRLADGRRRLHSTLDCIEAQQAVNEAYEELKVFECWKAEGARLRSRAGWRNLGDRGTREFFQAVKPKGS